MAPALPAKVRQRATTRPRAPLVAAVAVSPPSPVAAIPSSSQRSACSESGSREGSAPRRERANSVPSTAKRGQSVTALRRLPTPLRRSRHVTSHYALLVTGNDDEVLVLTRVEQSLSDRQPAPKLPPSRALPAEKLRPSRRLPDCRHRRAHHHHRGRGGRGGLRTHHRLARKLPDSGRPGLSVSYCKPSAQRSAMAPAPA